MAAHNPALFHAVIRRFLSNDHVVNVAFPQSRWGNPQEARFPLQLADVARAAVAHAGFQAADQLVDKIGQRAFGRNPPFDAFGRQLCVGVLL